MTKLLSQEEIDALLTNDELMTPDTFQEEGQKMVSVYDFRHPDRVSKDQLRALRTIHERFGRMFSTYLSSTLRLMIDIKVDSIDQVTYSEYAMSLSTPASIYVVNYKNLGGSGLIEISPDLFFFLIDRLLGGSGAARFENREVTLIEQKVLEKLMLSGLGFLNEAWSTIIDIGIELESFETNAQFIQIAPPSETVVVVILEVVIRDITYHINIAFPYYVIEPVMQKLASQSWTGLNHESKKGADGDVLRDNFLQTEVNLIANLGSADISVKDFVNLEKGDLIRLNERVNHQMGIQINEKQKFLASPGLLGNHKAVQIQEIITPEKEGFYNKK